MTLTERLDPPTRTGRAWPSALLAVFALALMVRLALVVTSPGGFTGNYGYDAGVYYASADALIHGRMPYADYLLLHPPGLTLALTPFAALGRLTSDHTGFIAANIAFSALGAANAALITLIARRLGLGLRAAVVGGVFYAVWLSAAGPEISARLEPLGTFAFLAGVLLLTSRTRGRTLLAGVALGFAVTVKIWWLVPLAVLLGWYVLVERDRRAARRLLGGSVAVVAVVLGPFFVHAPDSMWRMIVADQIGRHSSRTSPVTRIVGLSSVKQFGLGHGAKLAATVLVVLVAALLVFAAWRHRSARPIVLVAGAQLVVLLAAPTYFSYYSGFAAAAVALTVAAATDPRNDRSRRWWSADKVPVAVSVVAGIATVLALVGRPSVPTTTALPVGQLPKAVRDVPCVVADSPMALIATDSLSRGLANGCPNWVDVSGRTYDVDASPGDRNPRAKNQRWQADLLRYLTSGDAVIVIRQATGLSSGTRRAIHSLPVLARSGTVTVHRVGR